MKLALVGSGHWGRNHARLLRELRNKGTLDGFVVCDVDAERARRVAAEVGAETADDPAHVLADDAIDGLILASPTPTHFPLARAALEAGKDVLVEKPMTQTYAQSIELVRVAEGTGRILMVGHIFRYHAAVAEARRRIANGEFGRILSITSERQSFREPRTDMGVIHALGVHDLDLFCFLLDQPWPASLWATSAAWHLPDIEETAYMHATFPANVQCHALASWMSPTRGKERRLTIVGERMSCEIDYLRPDEVVLHDAYLRPEDGTFRRVDDGPRTVRVPYTEPLEAEVRDFLRCIATREEPAANMHAGARAVRMVEVARSMREGAGRVTFEMA